MSYTIIRHTSSQIYCDIRMNLLMKASFADLSAFRRQCFVARIWAWFQICCLLRKLCFRFLSQTLWKRVHDFFWGVGGWGVVSLRHCYLLAVLSLQSCQGLILCSLALQHWGILRTFLLECIETRNYVVFFDALQPHLTECVKHTLNGNLKTPRPIFISSILVGICDISTHFRIQSKP